MANPGARFVVYDEFDSKIGDDNGISLKIEPQRTVENLDHKVLLPMKISYNKRSKDSLIQISARPTGNEGLSTYESFRGQFFSTVVDEKYDQTPNSIPHLIEQKNPTKKMYVERRTWEEGINPTIQIITNQLEGVLDLHFLAIVSATERRTKIDTTVGIEITVEEIGKKTGNSRSMGTFEIIFDESSEHEFLFHEESVISTFEEKSLQTVGEGSSIHPKQLITVDSLRYSLTSDVTEIFQSEKIELGYIGLDTGENILSVIRYIKRKGLSNLISSLHIFYEGKWDDSYKKRLEPLIDNAADFDVKWHEVSELVALSDEEKEKKRDEFSVDFMISTYVAVWAANEEKIEVAEAEHYFRNAYEWCKEKALLLSIDPMDKLKIARSHRLAGRIDPTPYYINGGFNKWKESLGVGDSTICKETLWIKGDLKLKSKFLEAKKEDIEETNASVENVSSNVNTRVSNRLIEFIENNAGLIDCAGIPTESSKLVKADVLLDKNTQGPLMDAADEFHNFLGDIEPRINGVKQYIGLHKNMQEWSGINCGKGRVSFSGVQPQVTSEKWEKAVQKVERLLDSELPEVPFCLYSRYPTVITGKPGEGKSVRMRQICAEISRNQEISVVPVFLKAKHLAEYVNDYLVNDNSYEETVEPLSISYIQSNPNAKNFGLNAENVLQFLTEIKSQSDSGDNASGIVLIVDAIDEIENEYTVESLLEWLDHFVQVFGGGYSRFVISTRPSHLHHISEYFTGFNRFNMHFERDTLQQDFPKKLVDAWTMGDDIANRARELISDDDIFKHIDRPLLIGWLCRFIRDGEKDLGNLKESYSFFERILDYAIRNKRFEIENKYTETQINSIKRMRDCIAFIDLLRLGNSKDVLRLNSKENRLDLLKIRHTGFFPGLDDLSGEQVHKLFFEDMSLIFVSGSGDIEWTHDHLREYAAALFYTLDEVRLGDMIEIIKRSNYGIISKNIDLDEFVSQEIMPNRPYFRQAYQSLTGYATETTANTISIKRIGFREPRSTIKNKNGKFKLNEIEYRLEFLSTRVENNKDIEPSEYVDLTTDISLNSGALEENVNQIRVEDFNKENFIQITKFFISKNISWLFPTLTTGGSVLPPGRVKRSYPELLTGGIIPKLSQKLLTEEERKHLFKDIKQTEFESNKPDEESLKSMFFNHFMMTSENYNLIKYREIWDRNYIPTKKILESNKLLINTKAIDSLKKLYLKTTNSKKFFNFFQEYVQTNDTLSSPEMGIDALEKRVRKEFGNVDGWMATPEIGSWKDKDGNIYSEEVIRILTHSNLADIVNTKVPLIIDILPRNFFFGGRFISKLIRSYGVKNVRNPIRIVMESFAVKNEDNENSSFETNYKLIDGNKRMIILLSFVIEGYRRIDNLESMPENFNKIFYKDNTEKGTFVDFLGKPEEFGDDVEIFVKNIHSALDLLEKRLTVATLREAMERICRGEITVSMYISHCKECGSIEFETGEDGERYCKSCGAARNGDFGPED